MKPVKIPRRVDEPPHLLLWSADELAPMLLGTTFPPLLRQNWQLPTIWPYRWPECRMKTGRLSTVF